MSMKAYENAQNLIRHSGSPINLRDGLRALADAHLLLLERLETAERELTELRECGRMTDFQP